MAPYALIVVLNRGGGGGDGGGGGGGSGGGNCKVSEFESIASATWWFSVFLG